MTLIDLKAIALIMKEFGLTYVKTECLEVARVAEVSMATSVEISAEKDPIVDEVAQKLLTPVNMSSEQVMDVMFGPTGEVQEGS